MIVRITEAWPVVAAKIYLPGLIADHVTSDGYVCLWADDDPAQASAATLSRILERLKEWIVAQAGGFERKDQALDAFAFFERAEVPQFAEIDLPDLLGQPKRGLIRPVHAKRTRTWTFARSAEGHPLEGVLYYRSSMPAAPRDLREFLRVLTRAQRANLKHGLSRRNSTRRGTPSQGYDFALLVWPRYGVFDVLFVSFEGAGTTVAARAHRVFPSDEASRLHRAGPHARELTSKRVLLVGAGSVGSQVALALASSGVGFITIRDDARLRTVNLTRHVLTSNFVGFEKSAGLAARIEDAAPWCKAAVDEAIPANPEEVPELVQGFDLVVDCSGNYAATIALAHACSKVGVDLVTVALYHSGDIYRVRRQAVSDTPLLDRIEALGYPVIPDSSGDDYGFLELGCTAPIHNAPPAAVTRAASDGALVALDHLTGEGLYPADQVTVLRPLADPPFDRIGTIHLPYAGGSGV